jgi:PAS domain S-box-containing protein
MTQVLIVDDNRENRYLLRMLVQGYGATVQEATNGADALALAQQQPPSLIISDLLMPVMDGYSLLRHWKADDRLKAVPFMVYTATYTDAKDEHLALELGADAFVIKPAEPEMLLACIADLLAQPPVRPPQTEDGVILEHYSAALFRKLEEKVRSLEDSNRELRQEIAVRQQAEAALRDSEERYRQLFQAITDPLFVYDRNTLGYLAVNDAAVAQFGYSHAELLTMTLRDLCHPDDLPTMMGRLAQSGSGLQQRATCRYRKKNGDFKTVEISAYGLTLAGQLACLVQTRAIPPHALCQPQ